MKTYNPVLRVLLLCLAFTGIANAASTPELAFKFKRAYVPGLRGAFPATVNNNGVEVGWYLDKQGGYHGYMFGGANLTLLDDPSGTNTTPQAIPFNNENAVVGYYTNLSGNTVGFLYDTATQQFTDIPGPEGATASAAEGINDQGWISGFYTDSSGVPHGFLLQGTSYTTLDPPHTIGTYAYGVNNNGDVAITWLNRRGVYEGSLFNYSANTYKTLNVPGAANGSEASYINNEGDITLWWFDSNFLLHGALYTKYSSKHYTFYTFDYPNAYQTVANGINDNNVFAGWFEAQKDGPLFGYVATFK